MPKKKPMKGKPEVNEELEGLDVRINQFGQIESSFDMKKIIAFLNRNVNDKKLRYRKDISETGDFLNTQQEEAKPDEPTDQGTDSESGS